MYRKYEKKYNWELKADTWGYVHICVPLPKDNILFFHERI